MGPFDLAHAASVVRAVEVAEPRLDGCRSIDVDLGDLDRIDGTGAVLLARLLDRLDADGRRTHVVEDRNPEAARLIALYRGRGADRPAGARATNVLTRIGAAAAEVPGGIAHALDFTGRCAVALQKASRARSDLRDPRRLREREEYIAAVLDRS
jgi:phospholipid/cholesterol/gamma-HCH transport system permease protein